MPYICYDSNLKPSNGTMNIIDQANEIIAEYQGQGFDLTLRQLYYQFVSRGFIANRQAEYNKLGTAINTGRMVGLIDWETIVDRTRYIRQLNTYETPAEIIRNCVNWYRQDLWRNQRTQIEVWIEKDALIGVIEKVCNKWRVPYFSCRGYVSQSEMWSAAQRIRDTGCEKLLLLHLGDHDPSGIDMTRDITDRISNFLEIDGSGTFLEVKRIALNMSQVDEFSPPPNPAKSTDSRFAAYIEQHGESSWELDALEPAYLAELIEDNIRAEIDFDQWNKDKDEEKDGRSKIAKTAGKM